MFNQRYPFRYAPQDILLNSNDRFIKGCIAATGEYSEAEVDMFRDCLGPDDIAVEVGANMGAHTLALASIAKGVITFEPQRLMFQVLCANLANNSIANVMAMPMAVGATQGHITVPVIRPDGGEYNYGALTLVPDTPYEHGETVLQVTLDSFNLSECALLKLDCEGMELDVLQGATKLIERCMPWIYLEYTSRRAEILAFLEKYKYVAYRHLPRHQRTPNFAGTGLSPDNEFSSDMVLACPLYREPKVSMQPPFGQRHQLMKANTEDLFGIKVVADIWEPYGQYTPDPAS